MRPNDYQDLLERIEELIWKYGKDNFEQMYKLALTTLAEPEED